MYSKDTRKTNLGILIASGLVNELSSIPNGLDEEKNIAIYGASWGEDVPEIQDESKLNILIIHASIGMSKVWNEQENLLYGISFLREHKYDLILCGDIHKKFTYSKDGRIIVNTGCMNRLNASKDSMEHEPCFAWYDTETKEVTWEIIPHEPADKVLSRDHIKDIEISEDILGDFTDSLSGEIDADLFEKNLNELLEKETKEVKIELSKLREECDNVK